MGNTESEYARYDRLRDHPHIHGEYGELILTHGADYGSPPHTWGILSTLCWAALVVRITPTYMGNTCLEHWHTSFLEDHPHIHGEYQFIEAGWYLGSGSPPHTWGIPTSGIPHRTTSRITPTYMGNTPGLSSDRLAAVDHPHIHGEYPTAGPQPGGAAGSPPHTWGILFSDALFSRD